MPHISIPSGPTLAYDDTGGDGPAVIFSHGLFMNRSMFETQLAALRTTHRCIAWDERSHGETIWTGPYSLWDSARDQLALMDHLEIERAIWVGMSQGGLLSTRGAILAPERVSGLVMLDSSAGTTNEESGAAFMQMAQTWDDGPSSNTLASIATSILGTGIDADPWLAVWRAMPAAHVRNAVDALVHREALTDRLHEIDCPVLVIHGSADASTAIDRAQAFADGVRDCRGLVIIDGAPHASNLSHPAEVNDALSEFFTSVESTERDIP